MLFRKLKWQGNYIISTHPLSKYEMNIYLIKTATTNLKKMVREGTQKIGLRRFWKAKEFNILHQ